MTIERVVPILPTTDFDASRQFYVDVLGFDVVMEHGWITTFASPDNPSAQLSVIDQDATALVNPAVSIGVSDVEAAHAAAVEAGMEVVHPLTDEAWGVRRFFVRDPNGIVVNVVGHLA
jgi:catechol 2,3-dioxygenase-like lactoylglutathione lyase family enzyme